MILDALGRSPSWADDPRLYLRYAAALCRHDLRRRQGIAPRVAGGTADVPKQALELLPRNWPLW